MTKYFEELIKASGNEYASIVEDGVKFSDLTGFVDSGSYALNALMSGSIYGGYPGNKITALCGQSASGKSFAALTCVKTFLDLYKDGYVFYFDSEAAITKTMCKERNIDIKRMAILGVSTVEEFKFQVIKIMDAYKNQSKKVPILIVLDSLGMLSTSKEVADTAEGKETRDMTRAAAIKSAFRVLTLKAGVLGVPIVITNHTYASVSAYVPTQVVGGGSGIVYSASTILMLSKSKDKDGTDVTGNIVKCKLEKGRFTKEHKMVHVLIDYKNGLDRYYGLLEIAEKHGIVKKVGNKYEFPDGQKAFEKEIKNNPETYYTKDVLNKIDEVCKLEFCYGNDDNSDDSLNLQKDEDDD